VSETDGVDSVKFNGFEFGIANVHSARSSSSRMAFTSPFWRSPDGCKWEIFNRSEAKYRDQYQNLVANVEPNNSGIRFYPNPAQNASAHRKHFAGSAATLSVTDMQGKVIDARSLEGTSIHAYSVADYPERYLPDAHQQ
jgi:hypothetical protein